MSDPLKTVTENTVSARPLCRLLLQTIQWYTRHLCTRLPYNMSANTAPTIVSGQAPKNPPKNLDMKIVWTSFPVATARLKIEKPNDEMMRGYLLPYSSDIGAQTMGPKANPST